VTAYANKTDYGINIGFGSKFKKGINFGVRYNYGLSNINNENLQYKILPLLEYSNNYI
jgi:hypothetical protein